MSPALQQAIELTLQGGSTVITLPLAVEFLNKYGHDLDTAPVLLMHDNLEDDDLVEADHDAVREYHEEGQELEDYLDGYKRFELWSKG